MNPVAPLSGTSFQGLIGIAHADITPPEGIFARNWGAALSDASSGLHRPLQLSAVTLQETEDSLPLVLIAADLGWWQGNEEEGIRSAILTEFDLPEQNVLFSLSHTHSGPGLCSEDANRDGGEHIQPYLDQLRTAAVSAVRSAGNSMSLRSLDWGYGHSDLAVNRDLPDPNGGRYVTGWNPENSADTTLLVGRICETSDELIAVLVNYACHPTTLAWDNRTISPDFVGSMRETVKSITGADAIFFQGASGELSPRLQYSGDTQLADRHGRCLGYSVLSLLELMPENLNELVFSHVKESGAPLAIWASQHASSQSCIRSAVINIDIPIQNLPCIEELQTDVAACNDPVITERLRRKLRIRKKLGDGQSAIVKVWIWQIGGAFVVATGNEAYSLLQTELRSRYSRRPVMVMNVTNGHIGYLPPDDLYEHDIYSVWQTPYAKGSLEKVITSVISMLDTW